MLTCHPGIRGPFPKILPLLAETLRSLGCQVVEEPWGRHSDEETLLRKLADRPADILRIRRRLKKETFDVLFIHTTTEWANYSRDLPLLALCRGLVKHVVLQFHGSCPSLVLGKGQTVFKWASRILFNSVDGVFVLSTEEQRAWRQFHPAGKFPVISNPFQPLPPAAPDLAKLPWTAKAGEPVVLFVGRLITEKGIYDLLEAVAQVRVRLPVHLVLAGGGPEEENFRKRIQALGLATSTRRRWRRRIRRGICLCCQAGARVFPPCSRRPCMRDCPSLRLAFAARWTILKIAVMPVLSRQKIRPRWRMPS